MVYFPLTILNYPHQTCIYHRWCTVKIHSRCSRRLFYSVLIEKSKPLKLKLNMLPPSTSLNSLQKNVFSAPAFTHTYAYAFQDGGSGFCLGTTRDDRSPLCPRGRAPAPFHRSRPAARSSAVASRATQGKAGGSTVYLTQPRCPSARLGFDCRHLTTAQARWHKQFKRFFFFHGLGEKGGSHSQHLTTGTLTPRTRRLLREDKKAGSESARSRREGRRRAQRAPGRSTILRRARFCHSAASPRGSASPSADPRSRRAGRSAWGPLFSMSPAPPHGCGGACAVP